MHKCFVLFLRWERRGGEGEGDRAAMLRYAMLCYALRAMEEGVWWRGGGGGTGRGKGRE